MKLAFVVNDLEHEGPSYTTTLIAHTARRRGHDVFHVPLEEFRYRPEERFEVRAFSSPSDSPDREEWLEALQSSPRTSVLSVTDLDVVLLRNNPADEAARPWAEQVAVSFGYLAMHMGVFVVNDPGGLSRAHDKLYLQSFPEEVRPKTLISRDRAVIRDFADEQRGEVVLKPLHGSGGQNVFLARHDDRANLNQMIDAIRRDGYVIAQEYIPAAEEGDVRFLLLDGRPLFHEGKYAAIRRVRSGGDLRSNIHAGGRVEHVEVDENMLRVARVVSPKLVADGMFLVGLDIAGDKILEINVFSPGGMVGATEHQGVPFADPVLESLERKVMAQRRYPHRFDNAVLATL